MGLRKIPLDTFYSVLFYSMKVLQQVLYVYTDF